MKNYDVIIIGAGPSGIFCAYELIHAKKDLKVLMIEKGRRIENRECPKRNESEFFILIQQRAWYDIDCDKKQIDG